MSERYLDSGGTLYTMTQMRSSACGRAATVRGDLAASWVPWGLSIVELRGEERRMFPVPTETEHFGRVGRHVHGFGADHKLLWVSGT